MELTTHTPKGLDKIKRYGWTLLDKPGELRMLHKDVLRIHPAYQRDQVAGKISEISANWSWLALGALVVGERDGEFWTIDGQHRLGAALRRSDVQLLPCVVFQTENIKQEAQAFLTIQTMRKPVTALSKQKAMVTAEDEVAVYVQFVCDNLGITISHTSSKARTLKCVAWCIKRATVNKGAFRTVLQLGLELCSADDMHIPERVLEGLWILNEQCGEGLQDKRLVKRLREKGGRTLLEAANRAAAYYASGGGKVWAQGMLSELNKGLQQKFTLRGVE
jgi:hypothetical protein